MGRSFEGTQRKSNKERISQVRPKLNKFKAVAADEKKQKSSTNKIEKNSKENVNSSSNFETQQNLGSCSSNLVDCPLLNDFKKGLKISVSNHVNLEKENDPRLCQTSRDYCDTNDRFENSERENLKMSKQKSNEKSEKNSKTKEGKEIFSKCFKQVIRSTRAQDLRSQSNRDLLKPKTTTEKTRTTSPYVTSMPQKKKKCANIGISESKSLTRSNTSKTMDDKKKINAKTVSKSEKSVRQPYKGKLKKDKPSTAGDNTFLQRQKTQEIINPKILKKSSSNLSSLNTASGDFCGVPSLKKSQTFFICKGTKTGEGGDRIKEAEVEKFAPQNESESEGNVSDEDVPTSKPKPLTHNDSFCLIVKSSQNWFQKNRSDDEKWLQYGLACKEKPKKTSDKGILKNGNYDLKSVDSLEKVESEKIVRFSDELGRNKKILKRLVRRKKRLQNLTNNNWYQKNKLFQKYLQVLRGKSVLLSEGNDIPEDLKPFRVPIEVKERQEAEMFGLFPRKGKSSKSHTKDAYSY